LLAAFVLVSVPPLLLLAVAVSVLFTRSFEHGASARLDSELRTATRRIARLRERAAAQLAALATLDLPAMLPVEDGDRGLADSLGQRRDLAAFEILDAAGRVVSSRHWPAGFGLEDNDLSFAGDDALRFEKVADGYGVAERLALMPSHPARWRGQPVTLRGGPFIDADFLDDLSSLMGDPVGLRDVGRGRWVGPPDSPFRLWQDPPFGSAATSGEVALGGVGFRWAAAPALPTAPALVLVVATPRTPLDVVTGQLRVLSLGIAAAALAGALLAALVLSVRIARPVGALAESARRVAAGELTTTVPVETADEIGELAGAFNSMTADLRASHERLLQAERVAAWREMARRLAHELKNPLFPIQLSIETLRRADAEARGFPALFREASQTILDELRALRKIIEEFSEFARLPRPQFAPTDPNAVVEQVLALYQARCGALRIERALDPGLPTLRADRDLIARALGNLVANAIEAMPEGGTLSVRTKPAAGAIALEVGDSGPGLTDEQRSQLFTPYYTTKPGGTGLGLAIVQGVVADHGGRIEILSQPGAGTTFRILLPT
jgi:signal transduction histidine kinase